MGNKTRRQHNKSVKRSQHASPAPASMLDSKRPVTVIEFPFHVVDNLTMMFGSNIPGYQAVIDACPPEFKDNYRNQWCALAERIFFGGANMQSWHWRNSALKSEQLRYLKTWLGSFEPQHETKEAVCAWLLSLMLTECPKTS